MVNAQLIGDAGVSWFGTRITLGKVMIHEKYSDKVATFQFILKNKINILKLLCT